MNWTNIRKTYPDKWVVIEGLDFHNKSDRIYFDDISVLEIFDDGASAMDSYRKFHKRFPQREFYFIHTKHENLEIKERKWLGVRI